MKAFVLMLVGGLAWPASAQVRVIAPPPVLKAPGGMPSWPMAERPSRPIPLSRAPEGEQAGDEQFRPQSGMPGRDVVWVPTPDSLVHAMLTVAGVGPRDFVVDLGSGDGRIPIAAARRFGARAHGIEYNPDLVALSRRAAQRAGVARRVTFAQGDIFASDFSSATVVTLYLLPDLNLRLRDRLLAMEPGTRILSHSFGMGDWSPDETIRTDDAIGYLWHVPARVGGRWAFEVGHERFTAELGQRFQQLVAQPQGPLVDGRLEGRTIRLRLTSGATIEGRVSGNDMAGRGWVARRIGP